MSGGGAGPGATPGGGSGSAGPGGEAVQALRLAAARAASEGFGLSVLAEVDAPLRPKLEDLEGELGPGTLAVLLAGGAGRTGLAVYAPELAQALLEWRLLGMMSEEAPAPRAMTATDAALLADLTDPMLAGLGAALGARPGGEWAAGYAQGARLEDVRQLPLRLAAGAYHGFRLHLRLGGAGRGGALFLALPEARPLPVAATAVAGAGPLWSDRMQSGVLGAAVTLNAVLWRLRMPVAQAGQLAPGDLVPLPAACLGRVRLEGAGRTALALGRLGQAHGERAVRIEGIGAAPAPDPIPDHADMALTAQP
ncbi:MAG: FliM/FliN family flagellar motor switch protein [Rhodobacteraceae bacterium]|nr:FliM/FliN family flagellar motor switch protein [Paracoccaceae bacterium]